ncbi:glycosyltransferase family 4 protein [Salinisphaera sp.]|uniref:glycosyltransferase family 4 protein n=1 Tax=Salinisphaera sp. TaxID=1914330 RepID=UPI000C44740A|nr:glycosyltransferase family 4 protein [Salinisphaera sp.]MBS63502.1 glycosyl transferase family 1 [Salinisphaera sp.]
MKPVTFMVAGALDQPTGGYLYDRAIIDGLRADGIAVNIVELEGAFPLADTTARTALDDALTACSSDASIVIDGLAACALPDVVALHAANRAIVILVHHPLCDETGLAADTRDHLLELERRALACAAHVVVTSHFTAHRLVALNLAAEGDITVVEPGVHPVMQPQAASEGPCRLLCVASLTPRKGHRLLVEALAQVAELDWLCDFVGDDRRDAEEARAIGEAIARQGLEERVRLCGAQDQQALDGYYARADIFVLASWYEGYGMVIDEAVAHGLPIVTTTGGALADTFPTGAGMAVAPGDAAALAGALRTLIADSEQRGCAAAASRAARERQRDWPTVARQFAAVLSS